MRTGPSTTIAGAVAPIDARRPGLATAGAVALFSAVTAQVFISILPRGLWEDGYFFIRFARNTWVHGVAGWNASDGPLHGMTSQLYQLLITAFYPWAPRHLVTVSKAISAASLLGTAICLFVWLPRTSSQTGRHALVVMGLGMPLVLNHMTTGLETFVALLWLAVWLREYHATWSSGPRPVPMALLVVGTYLVRPDATLIPGIALLACLRHHRRRTLLTFAYTGLGLGVCWTLFKLYYGTALPLAFYAKSLMTTNQPPEHVYVFGLEKAKNLCQFAYLYAPFWLIAWVGRTRMAVALLASAIGFCAYHAVFTVETMGHYSRFYMPAVVPLIAAAAAAWDRFLERARFVWAWLVPWLLAYPALKWLDHRSHAAIYIPSAHEIPYLCAVALLLAPTAALRRYSAILASFAILIGVVATYRISSTELQPDRAILQRQIAPRPVFRGLTTLAQLKPKIVYHTDMGAPGILLDEATVIDLDGLLNQDILFKHRTFEELCARDKPDAIFVPPPGLYPALRTAILESACFRDYRPLPERAGSRLALRLDRYEAYQRAAAERAGR